MMRPFLAIAICAFFTATVHGQPDRYDLGLRMRTFEKALDSASPAARKVAVAELNGVVPAFFAGKYQQAANMLDRARLALRQKPASPAEVWAESLIIRPDSRLVDPAEGTFTVRVLPCYDVKSDRPKAELKLTLVDAKGKDISSTVVNLMSLPTQVAIPLANVPEGDQVLRAEVVTADGKLANYEVGISVVNKLRARLDALSQTAKSLPEDSSTADSKSLIAHSRRLNSLANREQPETDFPAVKMLNEAEELSKAIAAKQAFYGSSRPGQFWLNIPANAGGAAIRLYVPPAAKDGKPLPLVIALHGAGGSENMFFDSYGAGAIVRACESRGWLLVATRAVGFGAAPPVAEIIDALAKLYPVDQSRVFLVGHSMGAAHTMMLLQQKPERLAGAAMLGGGGLVKNEEALKRVPLFVGCGTEDFAIGSARAVGKAIEKAGNPLSKLKEYPDCEHVIVCQVAMDDVFRFFESVSKK